MQRVTHEMITDTLQANLNDILRRLQKTHEQVSSGRRLRRPSDDPPAVNRAVSLRSTIQLNDQYLRTINLSKTWLETSESALGILGDVLSRAKELAVQGANDTYSPIDRQGIAQEVGQLLGAAVAAANSQTEGAYLFAGFKITTTPFAVTGSTVTYVGDTGLMPREIGPGLTITINLAGDVAGHHPISDVLDTLADLRDALNTGTSGPVSAELADLDAAAELVSRLRAEIGAKVNRFEFTEERLQDMQVDLTRLLSEAADVDMAEAITRFNLEESVYKAALAAGGRAIQPSLMDFLR